MLFHIKSNYDYYFIIKELEKDFEGEFNCVRENTEKYKKFLVPITKEVKRIDTNEEGIIKAVSYKLQFIDSARSMASSLSNFVENRVEGIHKVKCKYGNDNKQSEAGGFKYNDCE